MSDHMHGPDCAHGHGVPVKLGAVGGKEPCPCGSGKKYKHCCYQKDATPGADTDPSTTAAQPDPQVSAEGGAAGEAQTEAKAKAPGKPKAPAIARGPVMPPRNPPHGAAKALNRRSGHR